MRRSGSLPHESCGLGYALLPPPLRSFALSPAPDLFSLLLFSRCRSRSLTPDVIARSYADFEVIGEAGTPEWRVGQRLSACPDSILTLILVKIISSSIPFARGRFMRRLGVERDAAPAGAGTTYPRALGRPGSPSGPTTGVCRSLSAGRGIGGGGKPPGGRAHCPKPRHVPGSTVPAPEDAAVARSQASRFIARWIASPKHHPRACRRAASPCGSRGFPGLARTLGAARPRRRVAWCSV